MQSTRTVAFNTDREKSGFVLTVSELLNIFIHISPPIYSMGEGNLITIFSPGLRLEVFEHHPMLGVGVVGGKVRMEVSFK